MPDTLIIDPEPVRPVGRKSGDTSLDTPPPPPSAVVQTRLILPVSELPRGPDAFLPETYDDFDLNDYGDPIRGIRIAVALSVLLGFVALGFWYGLPWLADVLRHARERAL